MDLNLNPATATSGGKNSVAGRQTEASDSTDFSRLLARHSEGSQSSLRDNDLPGVQTPRDDNPARSHRDEDSLARTGQEESTKPEPSSPGRSARQGNEIPPTVLAATDIALGDSVLNLAALPGFLSTVGPLGTLNFGGAHMAGLEIVPADVRANLAGDIAANFTVRQGTQTVTLQLNPEHLGKVDVRLQAQGDRLSVRLVAANREAEAALRENIKDLSDSIRDKTGKYQQVDVRVELKSQGDQGSNHLGRERPEDDPREQEHGSSQKKSNQRDDRSGQEESDDPTAPDSWTQEG